MMCGIVQMELLFGLMDGSIAGHKSNFFHHFFNYLLLTNKGHKNAHFTLFYADLLLITLKLTRKRNEKKNSSCSTRKKFM